MVNVRKSIKGVICNNLSLKMYEMVKQRAGARLIWLALNVPGITIILARYSQVAAITHS